MIERVKDFCRQKELLSQGDRVVVGLSGGADSVCLFLVLLELAKEWQLTLFPVHINHNLRGAAAKQDEEFCQKLCEEFDLKLNVVSVQVKELAMQHGWTTEEAGRNARYQAFSELAKKQGCNRIAVAHHKNDQAETVLFQLFRGSRVKGLSGMMPKNGEIIRPLLCVTREEIEEFLQKKNREYCIDHTNFEEEYTRNLIRARILPAAEQVTEGAVEHIAATAEYLGSVERYLKEKTDLLYKAAVKEDVNATEVKISLDVLEQEDVLLQDRVLYEALCRAAGQKKDITAGYVAMCRELCGKQTGRRMDLPGGLRIKRNYGELWIGRPEKEPEKHCIPITAFPCEIVNPQNGEKWSFSLYETGGNTKKFIEKMGGIPNCTYTKWFDYDKINDSVFLRNIEPEDEIILYTDGRGKRVTEVLSDAKMPREERMRVLALTKGRQVLWIPGIRNSEGYRITNGTNHILIVKTDGGN